MTYALPAAYAVCQFKATTQVIICFQFPANRALKSVKIIHINAIK